MLAYQHSGFSVDSGALANPKRAMRKGRGDANPARAGATQALACTLLVGGFNRPHLRSVAAAVPAVRWPDAPDRRHYRGHADQEDS